MPIQILGDDNSSVLTVDPMFKAARVSLRPPEILSWNSLGAQSGALTGAAANAPVFAMRNIGNNLLMVRRIGIGFVTTTAFTAAQRVDFGLYPCRSFTASDTAQTAIVVTGNNLKHRTSLATFSSIDMRISNTAAITLGTRTPDTNPMSQVGGWSGGAGTTIITAQDNLLQHGAGDYPLILANNEGLEIQNLTAMGAVGVGTLYVNIEFAEAAAY